MIAQIPLFIHEEEVRNLCRMHDMAMVSFISMKGRSLKTFKYSLIYRLMNMVTGENNVVYLNSRSYNKGFNYDLYIQFDRLDFGKPKHFFSFCLISP